MSYMQCQKCGGMFGVIGRVVYTCGCVPPIPVPVTEVIEETIVTGPQPELGSGALRKALAELFELVESGELVRDVSRDGQSDWHMRMLKMTLTLKKAQEALSLSSPIEPPPATCGVIGYPEQGRRVCELLAGHDDYHMQGGVRWLGYCAAPTSQASSEIREREILERAAQVAEQYYQHLSTNGATALVWSVATDIRDDIRALAPSRQGAAKRVEG